MRSRMEEIRDSLYPGKIPYGTTKFRAWKEIMTSTKKEFLKHPLVPQFRRNVLSIKDMTVEIFLLTIQELYGPIFSALAAQKISFSGGKIPKTMEDVEEMFRSIGVVPDVRRKVVVLQLVQPMDLPSSSSSSPLSSQTDLAPSTSLATTLSRKQEKKIKKEEKRRRNKELQQQRRQQNQE